VRDLDALQKQTGLDGFSGIAHTRWATHGVPSEITRTRTRPARSAWCTTASSRTMPSCAPSWWPDGYDFASQTDTEVIAHLIERDQQRGLSLFDAVRQTVARLHGAYAIVADLGARAGHPGRRAAGLAAGGRLWRRGELFRLRRARADPADAHFSYLEEGDVAEITLHTVRICDAHGDE